MVHKYIHLFRCRHRGELTVLYPTIYRLVRLDWAAKGTMDNSLWDDLEDMSCPLNRLRTFVNWPHAFPTPAMLADAGFYFASGPDTTKCFCCKGEIGHWTPQMFPGEIHMERFNTCPFIARENARSPMNNLPPPSTQMQVACNGVVSKILIKIKLFVDAILCHACCGTLVTLGWQNDINP